jgi:hypothetical protein
LGLNFRSGIPAISCNKIILYVLLLTLMIVNEIDFFPVGIFRSTFIFINQIFIFLIALDIIRKNRNLRIFKYFRSKLNSSFYLHAAHMQVMFLIFSIYGLINLIYNLNLIYLEYLLPFVVFILSFIIIDGIANLMRVKTPRAYSLLSGKRKI